MKSIATKIIIFSFLCDLLVPLCANAAVKIPVSAALENFDGIEVGVAAKSIAGVLASKAQDACKPLSLRSLENVQVETRGVGTITSREPLLPKVELSSPMSSASALAVCE